MADPGNRAEVVKMGEDWMREHLTPDFVALNLGKLLLLEINGGNFEIGDEQNIAAQVARFSETYPGALIYLARLGSTATFELGHGTLDEAG